LTAAQPIEAEVPPASHLHAVLRRLKEGARKRGTPTCDARIDSLTRLEQALVARKDAIARTISKDFGSRSKHETFTAEIFILLGAIKHAKAHLRDWMELEERSTNWTLVPSISQVSYQPLGVVGIISPWNYPVQLALSPMVAALAAGNGAMLKPSELVPETAELIRDILAETFESDHVAVVTGGSEVGHEFARLPFDHLVFTGSTRVGKLVMRAASDNLVPVTLELGGKSPAIVGADFSPRTAAARIMAGKTLNAGQTCIAPDYALVPESARDAFVDACRAAVAKMYPSLEQNPDYTAIINEGHHARIRGLIEDARTRGASVVELNLRGESLSLEARKIAPTLILSPNVDMLCMQEEIFGPVLPIVTYGRLDEALEYVNARPRPLSLYYFGYDRATVDRVVAETISGGVTVNETMLHFVQEDLPFGGVGPSGMGQYHGREGFRSLSLKRPIFRQSRINTSRLMRPPFGPMADRLLRLLLRS
jgi:coniferyl-aldehyde dehydrogenase